MFRNFTNTCVLIAFNLLCYSYCFNTGAPDNSCRDPSVFHTRKVNATHEGVVMPENMLTNPYTLDVGSKTFKPGQKVTVSLRVMNTSSSHSLRGFFIQAIQANVHLRDLRRQAFGTFQNMTTHERPSPCATVDGLKTGGITHTNNAAKKVVRVTWVAPSDGHNPGNVQFLATGVSNYDTYWIEIRSPVVTADGYKMTAGHPHGPEMTSTGAWYQWLQYIRQQQLLQDAWAGHHGVDAGHYVNGAGHNKVEAGLQKTKAGHHNDIKTEPTIVNVTNKENKAAKNSKSESDKLQVKAKQNKSTERRNKAKVGKKNAKARLNRNRRRQNKPNVQRNRKMAVHNKKINTNKQNGTNLNGTELKSNTLFKK